MLTVEADADANTDVVLHALSGIFIVRVQCILRLHGTVRLALDNQTTAASGHKLLEDVGKLAGDLLEGSLNGLSLR